MILVDTGPLVALCDRRDSKHTIAVRQLATLADNEFGICESVLTETFFHLPHRSQRLRLRALLTVLHAQPIPTLNDPAFREEVLSWLERYADHEPDWADGCLAVLSGRIPRAEVWTFDREFKTTWRRSDGTGVAMA